MVRKYVHRWEIANMKKFRYPPNIPETNKIIWDAVIAKYQKSIIASETKYTLVRKLYLQECKKLGIKPFVTSAIELPKNFKAHPRVIDVATCDLNTLFPIPNTQALNKAKYDFAISRLLSIGIDDPTNKPEYDFFRKRMCEYLIECSVRLKETPLESWKKYLVNPKAVEIEYSDDNNEGM